MGTLRELGFRNGLIKTQLHFSVILLALSACVGIILRLASFMVLEVVVAIPLTSPQYYI